MGLSFLFLFYFFLGSLFLGGWGEVNRIRRHPSEYSTEGKVGKLGKWKTFLVLGSMMKILSKEIPGYEFVRKHGEESAELYTLTLKEQFNEEQI